MSEMTQPLKTNYIDREVVQRLLKAADFLVIFCGSMMLLFRAMTENGPELTIAAGFIALWLKSIRQTAGVVY